METFDYEKLNNALSKLNKTQSMIHGIRLGISVSSSASAPMQNMEDVFKLINADLQEISNILSSLTDNDTEIYVERQEITNDSNN